MLHTQEDARNERRSTNPIHDEDLAAICAEASLSDQDGDILAGGPDVYTRREVVELAFAAFGRPPRVVAASRWAPGALGALAWPLAPRVGDLMAFLGAVSAGDFVAPARGGRRLADYYRQLAEAVAARPAGA
ncbi:MAG TPA: hypothetical protein PKD53_21215 [Chloroflexaceae bacterium]|nr:hypothetical protein [Chloroflexaceae bacterium]